MNFDLGEWCAKFYREEFEERLKLAKGSEEDQRRFAQKTTIRATWIAAMRQFPAVDPAEIWNHIYQAHVAKNSGIRDNTTIQAVISADQSWKKSSGHAFEETIKSLANVNLVADGIEIILQKDLSVYLKEGIIKNQQRDLDWIQDQIKSSSFDLYLTQIVGSGQEREVFGCIQSKTSIRERVTRDREPSSIAMQHFFFSAAIVLNGDFMRLPKFQYMVNGGSSDYLHNGWHGLYVFSTAASSEGRIHQMGLGMEIFVRHAKLAAKSWKEQRQWMNHDWMPV